MPFFNNARDFNIKGAQMNDVAGDYTANYTTTTANNTDSNNVYLGSSVRKGNTETHNASIGNGDGNTISFGGFGAGIPAAVTPELLQRLGQVLPAGIPGLSAQAASQSFAAAPQSATPLSTVSTSLAILRDVPANSWTPEMLTALDAFVTFIQGALKKAARA